MTDQTAPTVQQLRQEVEQALRSIPMGFTLQAATDAVTPILERLCADLAAARDERESDLRHLSTLLTEGSYEAAQNYIDRELI